MARIWYCPNCGYEVRSRGRCHACREKLIASDLPELEPGAEDDEVGYRLGGWRDRDRGRLIEFLNALQISHRFEEDELVVGAEDEERVDDLVAELMATASDDDDDGPDDLDDENPFGIGETGAVDENAVKAVALLADAARRLRADPTDMQADADVAEASTVVFFHDSFYGVDDESWAAVGRVTRRLLSALGAEEALEEEIRLQAGVLAKLLASLPASGPGVSSPYPGGADGDQVALPLDPAAVRPAAGRLAVGTVYDLTEWLPEQRAHLGVLLDDNKIAFEWDGDDLVVESSRETETEALFSLVGGLEPSDEDDEADEERYHAIEELFSASGRLASNPDDPERRGDALSWAGEVDGPAPVGMDEVFWLRVVNRIHSLVAALESGEDDDLIATEAGTLHDLLRTIV
ncbi:MAG TPA: hypothetical protein VFV02_04160 [Acidimicrobiales bacterium]|nr:hypothetical protein [Acidimicrobiales bacterium]